MADITPINFTSGVGRVRKYIPDVVQSPDPADPSGPVSFMWSDDQIESFLSDEWNLGEPYPSSSVRRAAAYILIATANNENLILKKIVTEDLETDGPAVAKAMLASAQELLKRADLDEEREQLSESFIIVGYEGDTTHAEGTEWPVLYGNRPVYYGE
jgi:hypothetical protein